MRDDFIKVHVSNWKCEKKIKVCIISIIYEEMLEIVKAYDMKSVNDSYIYWEGGISEFPDITVHCYQQNESGNIYSEQLTKYVLEKDCDYYFCVGTSGAVQARLYDVIIANQIIYLGKGANTVEGREYDGKAPEIREQDKNLINTFLVHLGKSKELNFSVVAEPVISGENVEKNPMGKELEEGKKFVRHLAAIDMESFGVFQALRFNEVFNKKEKSVYIIRGISDRADGLKNLEYEDGLRPDERKQRAMKNVLEVLNEFIVWLNCFNK